jgi:hypothetical protein
VISGTATVISANTQYAVDVTNNSGTVRTTFNLKVDDKLPVIIYPRNTYVLYQNEFVSIVPDISTGGTITSWNQVSLPAGLNFNNGTISGTPTNQSGSQLYQITGTNTTGGSADVFLNISIVKAPPAISCPLNQVLTVGVPVPSNTIKPTLSRGATTSVTSSLNTNPIGGLTIDLFNGALIGTPTTPGSYSITLTANNETGSVSCTYNVTVNPETAFPPVAPAVTGTEAETVEPNAAPVIFVGVPMLGV